MKKVPYEIIRSKRKTLALTIDREGKLLVRAPMRLSEDIIHDFIKEKMQWIRRKQQQMLDYANKHSSIVLKDGAEILYLGKHYTVRRQAVPEVTFIDNLLLLPQDMTLELFRKWMKAESADVIRSRVGYYAELMGVQYKSVKMSEARTRWGSCGAKDTLNFAWRLVMCPQPVIDYVVVHELSHISYKNHSAKFWERVAELIPGYKEAQLWLRQNSSLMDVI